MSSNRLDEARAFELNRIFHQQRLERIKPSIDNSMPYSYKQRLQSISANNNNIHHSKSNPNITINQNRVQKENIRLLNRLETVSGSLYSGSIRSLSNHTSPNSTINNNSSNNNGNNGNNNIIHHSASTHSIEAARHSNNLFQRRLQSKRIQNQLISHHNEQLLTAISRIYSKPGEYNSTILLKQFNSTHAKTIQSNKQKQLNIKNRIELEKKKLKLLLNKQNNNNSNSTNNSGNKASKNKKSNTSNNTNNQSLSASASVSSLVPTTASSLPITTTGKPAKSILKKSSTESNLLPNIRNISTVSTESMNSDESINSNVGMLSSNSSTPITANTASAAITVNHSAAVAAVIKQSKLTISSPKQRLSINTAHLRVSVDNAPASPISLNSPTTASYKHSPNRDRDSKFSPTATPITPNTPSRRSPATNNGILGHRGRTYSSSMSAGGADELYLRCRISGHNVLLRAIEKSIPTNQWMADTKHCIHLIAQLDEHQKCPLIVLFNELKSFFNSPIVCTPAESSELFNINNRELLLRAIAERLYFMPLKNWKKLIKNKQQQQHQQQQQSNHRDPIEDYYESNSATGSGSATDEYRLKLCINLDLQYPSNNLNQTHNTIASTVSRLNTNTANTPISTNPHSRAQTPKNKLINYNSNHTVGTGSGSAAGRIELLMAEIEKSTAENQQFSELLHTPNNKPQPAPAPSTRSPGTYKLSTHSSNSAGTSANHSPTPSASHTPKHKLSITSNTSATATAIAVQELNSKSIAAPILSPVMKSSNS